MHKRPVLSVEHLISLIPAHIYWKDEDGFYLGCNLKQAQSLGFDSPNDIIGKSDFEISSSKEAAERFRANDLEIMRTKSVSVLEENTVVDGKGGVVLSQKIPLYDEEGDVAGVLGISIDITARKRAEEEAKIATEEATNLKVENAGHRAQLEAQEQISKNANQVAHDIRSPLSTLLILLRSCHDLPEDMRIAIREAATGIGDIANNLLSKYKKKDSDDAGYVEEQVPVLLSTTLLHALSDKKHQYTDLQIKFEHALSPSSHFVFIQIGPSSFKRMISNIINNAVDAFEKRKGKIILKLEVTSEIAAITIEDNGKGMPPHVVEKILQNIEVTAGKAEGHGIGLTQVRETLARNQGKMSIHSQINQGTQIILEFPRIKTPGWIAEEIKLGKEDIIVILDDDTSVHLAWDMRFKSILEEYPQIKVKHFENGVDAIEFIKGLTEEKRQKVNLLTDYELLKQEFNGLHVVEKTKIKRSILVTSHYADSLVLERAKKVQTKILPKQLASEVPVYVDESIQYQSEETTENQKLKTVDLILVDDDKRFAETLMMYVFGEDEVDYFEDPQALKDNLKNYPKDTRIYLDNNFKAANIRGLDIAKELHEKGFTRLYLLTGDTFEPSQMPKYLKVVRKDDIENIKDWGR